MCTFYTKKYQIIYDCPDRSDVENKLIILVAKRYCKAGQFLVVLDAQSAMVNVLSGVLPRKTPFEKFTDSKICFSAHKKLAILLIKIGN